MAKTKHFGQGGDFSGTALLAQLVESEPTTSKRTRKPFTVGSRVERRADGQRGTVESVQSFEGAWAVAVRMDDDGQTWSGTQETRARGAWKPLSGDAPTRDEMRANANAKRDDAAKSRAARTDIAEMVAYVAERAKSDQLPPKGAAQGVPFTAHGTRFVCTFPECIHHPKTK